MYTYTTDLQMEDVRDVGDVIWECEGVCRASKKAVFFFFPSLSPLPHVSLFLFLFLVLVLFLFPPSVPQTVQKLGD